MSLLPGRRPPNRRSASSGDLGHAGCGLRCRREARSGPCREPRPSRSGGISGWGGRGRIVPTLRLRRHGDDHKTIEILLLRYQLAVLQRQLAATGKRPRPDWADHAIIALLVSLVPKAPRAGLRLVTPDTILRCHRDLLRRRWAKKQGPSSCTDFSAPSGRSRIDAGRVRRRRGGRSKVADSDQREGRAETPDTALSGAAVTTVDADTLCTPALLRSGDFSLTRHGG